MEMQSHVRRITLPPLASRHGIPETSRCILLEAPPEVRNRIYEYLFPHPQRSELPDILDSELLKPDGPVASEGLLLTCRQIYEEAKHVYHGAWLRPFALCIADKEDAEVAVTLIRKLDHRLLRRVLRVVVADPEARVRWIMWEDGQWEATNLPDIEDKHKMMLVPGSKGAACMEEMFMIQGFGAWRPYWCVDSTHFLPHQLERLTDIVGRRWLTKGELVVAVRKVGASI